MLKNILFIAMFVPQMVFAAEGFSLNPALGMYKNDENNGMSQLELRLGYTFDFGLYVGGFYSLASQDWIEDSDDFYMGATVGYEYKGIFVLASYILAGDQDLKAGGVKYTGANGTQATLGYRALIAENIYLAPEITFRNVKFEDVETLGIPTPTDRKDSVVIPGLSVLFAF